jgi:hypothetical protein
MLPKRVLARDVDDTDVGLVAAHAVRNALGTRFVLRKGEIVGSEHVKPLRELGSRELHLLGIQNGELHEAEAGARLARAIAGPGISLRGPAESQYTLLADHRGLLRVDVEHLHAVNGFDELISAPATASRPCWSASSPGSVPSWWPSARRTPATDTSTCCAM